MKRIKWKRGDPAWMARKKHGRTTKLTPDQFKAGCLEYFEWSEQNPLKEQKVFCVNGRLEKTEIDKMRAFTIVGACIFLGISRECWYQYKKRKEFVDVVKSAEYMIYQQKFTGGAAGLLNSNIIARDLGLSDKQEIDNNVKVIEITTRFEKQDKPKKSKK